MLESMTYIKLTYMPDIGINSSYDEMLDSKCTSCEIAA